MLLDSLFFFFKLNSLSDLQVYVEFDDQEWEKREWVKVYEDFQLFLLEHQLVWAKRIEGAGAGGAPGGHLQGTKAKQIQWPALVSPLMYYRCFHNVRGTHTVHASCLVKRVSN